MGKAADGELEAWGRPPERALAAPLTPFWPDSDRDQARRAAEAVYSGEVGLAPEVLEVSLP
jgi:hypothetical protein